MVKVDSSTEHRHNMAVTFRLIGWLRLTVMHTSLILHIHVMVNWQLPKGYLLTSTMWPYHRLRCKAYQGQFFVGPDQTSGFINKVEISKTQNIFYQCLLALNQLCSSYFNLPWLFFKMPLFPSYHNQILWPQRTFFLTCANPSVAITSNTVSNPSWFSEEIHNIRAISASCMSSFFPGTLNI